MKRAMPILLAGLLLLASAALAEPYEASLIGATLSLPEGYTVLEEAGDTLADYTLTLGVLGGDAPVITLASREVGGDTYEEILAAFDLSYDDNGVFLITRYWNVGGENYTKQNVQVKTPDGQTEYLLDPRGDDIFFGYSIHSEKELTEEDTALLNDLFGELMKDPEAIEP